MDCMFSADLMIGDTRKTANLLVDRLGLPALRSSWTDEGRSLDELIYLRAYHPLSAAAPTSIELVSNSLYSTMGIRPAAEGRQAADRPVRTHATVLITKHYPELIERLRAENVRHCDMPDPDGLSRCWFGVEDLTPTDPGRNEYDPDSDGGLFLEVISWQGTIIAARGPIPVNVAEGGITRVVARTYLVPDIDATMASLRRALDWPDPSVEVADTSELRYATLQPAMPESAALELVQPRGAGGRHGAFFAVWGGGPHAIRLGVNGLPAMGDDLRRRGTPTALAEAPDGEPVLLVEGDTLDGAIFEFVEDGAFVAKS